MKATFVALLFFALVGVGCVTGPERTSAVKRDLSGSWNFVVQTGANQTHGAMSLTPDGSSYRGTLTTNQGSNVLPVRSLTLTGSVINLVVESPQGNVVFDGILSRDADSFQGTVTYHTGEKFPMFGNRVK
jgi:hypothetical protein